MLSAGAPKSEPDPHRPAKDPPDPPRQPPKPPEPSSNHPEDPPEPSDPPKSKPPLFSGPDAAPPLDKPNLEDSSSRSQDSAKSGESLPAPAEAFGEPFKDLANFKDTQHLAENTLTYTEALGRFMKGAGAKVLASLFSSKDAAPSETRLLRRGIRRIGKGLLKVVEFAPLEAAVEFIDVFKERIGSSRFTQKYGMAGLSVIGSMVGVAAFKTWPLLGAWTFRTLEFLGLSAAWSEAWVPIVAGILGAAVFGWLGSIVNKVTQQMGGGSSGQSAPPTRRAPVPQIPLTLPKQLDPNETKKRPPSVFSPPFEPPRPDGAALGDDGPPDERGTSTSGGGPPLPPGPPSPVPLGGVSFDAPVAARSFRPPRATEKRFFEETKRRILKQAGEQKKNLRDTENDSR